MIELGFEAVGVVTLKSTWWPLEWHICTDVKNLLPPCFGRWRQYPPPKLRYISLKNEVAGSSESSKHTPKRTRKQVRPKLRYIFLKGICSSFFRKLGAHLPVQMASLPRRKWFCRYSISLRQWKCAWLVALKFPHCVFRFSVFGLKLMIQKSQNENQWPETRKTKATKNQIIETSCTCKRCVPSWCTTYVKCAVLLLNSLQLFPTRLIKMNIVSFNVCQTARRSKSDALKAKGCCEDIWEQTTEGVFEPKRPEIRNKWRKWHYKQLNN